MECKKLGTNSIYFGETARTIGLRSKDHWRDREKGDEGSHMHVHERDAHGQQEVKWVCSLGKN